MHLQSASVKTLMLLLKNLSPDQTIGFDPYRDPRTQTKTALIQHILSSFKDADIIREFCALEGAAPKPAATHTGTDTAAPGPHGEIIKTPPVFPPFKQATDTKTDAEQLAELLARMSGPKAAPLDADAVNAIINPALEANIRAAKRLGDALIVEVNAKIDEIKAPTRVVFQVTPESEPRDLGLQHKAFPDLLKASSARLPDGHRLNIWLKGPAGSGKTTAAKNIADALSLPFHFNGAIDTKFELTGFVDASGRYHRTAFREAFEHGGVYLFDEIDCSNPGAVKSFNAALANGIFTFPDGQIKRHADCLVLAGANTAGNGATHEYVAGFKQDASSLDRFVVINWELDEALETALSTNTTWTAYVQKTRAKASKREIKNFLITPRASLYGAALLAAGLSRDAVKAMAIQKGLAQDAWETVDAEYPF